MKACEGMGKIQMNKQTNTNTDSLSLTHIQPHTHTQKTHKTVVNLQCNESSCCTGSHGVPVGEAKSNYFWEPTDG